MLGGAPGLAVAALRLEWVDLGVEGVDTGVVAGVVVGVLIATGVVGGMSGRLPLLTLLAAGETALGFRFNHWWPGREGAGAVCVCATETERMCVCVCVCVCVCDRDRYTERDRQSER